LQISTPLSYFGRFSLANTREYSHKPCIVRNYSVLYLHSFSESTCILKKSAFKVIQGRWFWH